MCRLLCVSRSGYYAAKTRPESARSKLDRELLHEIKRVHEKSKGVYGSPRIQAELADEGHQVGRHKVAKLMRLERLRGCPKRRYRVTTKRDPRHRVAKNLLEQNFFTAKPDQKWVADITYSVPGAQGKHGCLNEPRVYLKYADKLASAETFASMPGCAGI